jgi:hypothetical protein
VYRGFLRSTKDLVKERKCPLSPNDKTADVTTGRQLEKVEATDVHHLNTWQVTKGFDDATVVIVDDEGTAALAVATIAHFSLTSTKLARVGDLYNVAIRAEGLEKCYRLLGLAERLNGIADNERNFLDLFDAVAASEDEGGKRGRGEGRNGSKAALVLVHLDVPSTPGLRGCEHPTTTTHVTERGLA